MDPQQEKLRNIGIVQHAFERYYPSFQLMWRYHVALLSRLDRPRQRERHYGKRQQHRFFYDCKVFLQRLISNLCNEEARKCTIRTGAQGAGNIINNCGDPETPAIGKKNRVAK